MPIIKEMIPKTPTGVWTVLLLSGCLIGGVSPLYAQSQSSTPRPPGINQIISGSTNDIVVPGYEAIYAERAEREKQACILENKGDLLLKQGKTDEAMATYRKAMALTPGFGNYYAKLGEILFDQGNFKDAAATYRQLFYSEEDKAWTNAHGGGEDDWARMAIAFGKIGDRVSAVGAYESSLKTLSGGFNVGSNTSKFVPFLAHFDDRTPQFSYTPERLEAVALTFMAVVKYNFIDGFDDGPECFDLLRRAIQLWPQYAQAHLFLADMLISYSFPFDPPVPDRKERLQEAAKELQSALHYGDLDVRAGARQLQMKRGRLLGLGGY